MYFERQPRQVVVLTPYGSLLKPAFEILFTLSGRAGRFELLQPLQLLHKAVLQAGGHRRRMPATLLRIVTAARKSGHLPQALTALQELQQCVLSLHAG